MPPNSLPNTKGGVMYPAFTSGIEMAEDIPSQQECNLERTVTAVL